ncbi:hypothetical protein BALAC2494_01999 [Bifidobacterium animalis subsp. lactis CNCM I-2494]|uniref:Uncharacterized protein n=1 Tax=Bifidobacterium animalis subsp. lactis CNCM I-2494 TaxID=1042403 RepID=A0A806FRP8_BIFAN|nr:hypothetical protein BALAC2494_01999 [Bifidobacterium animalis subsp. lactis CNCM I-2494]
MQSIANGPSASRVAHSDVSNLGSVQYGICKWEEKPRAHVFFPRARAQMRRKRNPWFFFSFGSS